MRIINSKIYIFIFALLIKSCAPKSESINVSKIFERAKPTDSLLFYFPEILNDTFERDNPAFRNFRQNWYSSTLYSLKEPILYKSEQSEPIYRFLWIRSFHAPMSFTIKKWNNSYYLNTKSLDRFPAFYPHLESKIVNGKTITDTTQKADRFANIVINQVKEIDKNEWSKFQSLLKKIQFWSTVSLDKSDKGHDGAQWILEGVSDGKYHFIERQSGQEIKECGTYLIDLSSLNLPENVVY